MAYTRNTWPSEAARLRRSDLIMFANQRIEGGELVSVQETLGLSQEDIQDIREYQLQCRAKVRKAEEKKASEEESRQNLIALCKLAELEDKETAEIIRERMDSYNQ